MLAVFLIIFGIILLGSGIWMVGQENSNTLNRENLEEVIAAALKDANFTLKEEQLIRDSSIIIGKDPEPIIQKLKADFQASISEPQSELIDVNVQAGLDFEKFVVKKFNPEFFVLKQWAGDKFVEGRYAESTLEPDLQLELKLGKNRYPLAVECKWRKSVKGDFIRFANDGQLNRYQEFESRTKMPTFIVLGVGGSPSTPERLYIIPVSAFKNPTQHIDNLINYKRGVDRNFFFDQKNKELR